MSNTVLRQSQHHSLAQHSMLHVARCCAQHSITVLRQDQGRAFTLLHCHMFETAKKTDLGGILPTVDEGGFEKEAGHHCYCP